MIPDCNDYVMPGKERFSALLPIFLLLHSCCPLLVMCFQIWISSLIPSSPPPPGPPPVACVAPSGTQKASQQERSFQCISM